MFEPHLACKQQLHKTAFKEAPDHANRALLFFCYFMLSTSFQALAAVPVVGCAALTSSSFTRT